MIQYFLEFSVKTEKIFIRYVYMLDLSELSILITRDDTKNKKKK